MKTRVLISVAIIGLSACANKEEKMTATQRIYQPEHLIFAPNTRLETIDGYYLTNSKEREVWHSAGYLEKVEQALSNFK